MNNLGALSGTSSLRYKLCQVRSADPLRCIVVYAPTLDLIMCNIYRPPAASLIKFQEILGKCTQAMQQAENANTHIFVVGDFNFPPSIVQWEKHGEEVIPVTNKGSSQDKLAFQTLQEMSEKHFLTQVIHQPTRKQNTLDLCYTNDPNSILNVVSTEVPITVSDHNFINITTNYMTSLTQDMDAPDPICEFSTLNFPAADHDRLHTWRK